MRSLTESLIKAMRILAVDIQSDDGIANAAISEAADRLEELQAKLEGGVRVHANQYVDRDDRWLCSHYGSRKDIHNATLILDDGAEI